MIMLIHKICMALRGLGNRSNVDTAINDKAAMLLEQTYTQTIITTITTDGSYTAQIFLWNKNSMR